MDNSKDAVTELKAFSHSQSGEHAKSKFPNQQFRSVLAEPTHKIGSLGGRNTSSDESKDAITEFNASSESEELAKSPNELVQKVRSASGVLAPLHMIGSSGGANQSRLEGHLQGKVITRMRVYSGYNCIKAYTFWLTDGNGVTYGLPENSNWAEFTFNNGERITSLTLWGNGAGTRAGWIEFTTSMGRRFSYGMYQWGKKTPYPIEVASGILVGAVIRHGWDIDAHGFLFLNPLENSQLRNVQYPTLGFDTAGIAPLTLRTFRYTNNSNEDREWRFTDRVSETTSSSWSIAVGLSVHMTISVSAGIPLVVDVSGEFGWEISVTGTFQTENSTTKEFSWDVGGTARPGTSVNLRATTRRGTLNIPYTGLMQVWLRNGATFSYPMSGWYDGVTFTDSEVVDG